MDEDRLQLQLRCAAAEEKAESLRLKLQALQGTKAQGKLEKLQQDFDELQGAYTQLEERTKLRSQPITRLMVTLAGTR